MEKNIFEMENTLNRERMKCVVVLGYQLSPNRNNRTYQRQGERKNCNALAYA